MSVIWRDALPVGRGRILTHIVARRRRDAAFLAASKTPDSEKSQAVGARVAARFKRHAGITDKLRGDSIHMGKGPIPIIPHEAVGGAAWIIPWTPSQVTVLRGAIRRPRTNLAAVAGHYKVKCITARI
ncbi:hypothetical protein [Phaeovulum sp.]|uniref:hypothetical protein n=1 Tax=Phaeovulum sp. TaxID=2934796 RepID=UPI0039E45DB9